MSLGEVLTVREVAAALRCSRAHVYKVIRGEVPGVPPLPVLTLGRRRLVRRSSFELWVRAVERGMLSLSPGESCGRVKGDFHA